MKQIVAYISLGALLISLLSMSACRSSRKQQHEYDYLRSKNQRVPESNEPFEVIDIAVLDTSQQVPTPDPSAGQDTPAVTDKPTEASVSKAIATVLNTARSYLGVPYQWGGMNRQGMDCSGLVVAAYLSLPLNLPRTSRALATAGTFLEMESIRPGDLVFFSSRMDGNINHVGLVTEVKGSEITFIHATVSRGVREDRLDIGYWSDRFMRSVRVGF
jgi:cell wall-associated NlpC family hydrolase